ncbi:MAG TPA: molybdopterin oxidoreductase family protein [Pyrinomonadaceae bacterium]|nr:molybdopterin oxidoreductase family protein [Pyrinomonadaceae bacterium]
MKSPDTNPAHYRNCSICEAICGIEITPRADGSLDIRGDKDDPFSHGYICPKAVALQDIHYDRDRLKHPVRRTPQGWQRIGWDEALDEVAQNLKRIQTDHGSNAVATYLGNPTVHSYGAMLFAPGFIRSLRTRNRFSATSVDQLAHHLAAFFMFGHQLLLPIPDIDRTEFLLMLGANPAVSNGSMMTAPALPQRLKDIRARGGKVVLIDPRRNETAALADRHLFIRPGTDAVLLLSVLHVILADNLAQPGALESLTDGVETIAKVVAPFPPAQAASITGIDPDQIRLLATEFATAESAVCYGRVGVSMQEFGGLCQWLINVLNLVTGNLDRAGGAMFTLPAFDPISAPEALAPRGSFGRWHSRVRQLPEFAGELPVATLAEEILTEGDGQIRALVTHGGNPVLSTPNGREMDRALASLKFMAAIDFYINETTRHAQIILPPTGPLERGHYDLAFHLLGVRNVAKFSPPLFQTNGETRHEWEIFLALQTRMEDKGLLGRLKHKTTARFLGPERMLDLGLRFGPYGDKLNPFSQGLNLRKLKAAVHGIDFGPMRPCLIGRLRTSDKRIHLAPEIFVKDIERLQERFGTHGSRVQSGPEACVPSGHLVLIGRRQLRSNNSWLHNSERMVNGKPRCTMLMHPDDAAHRELKSGQTVSVRSRAGSIEIPVEISDEIMPGTVSIPHGWGHNREGIQLSVAEQHAGQSLNDLTDNLAIDALCGTAAFSGIPVTVE